MLSDGGHRMIPWFHAATPVGAELAAPRPDASSTATLPPAEVGPSPALEPAALPERPALRRLPLPGARHPEGQAAQVGPLFASLRWGSLAVALAMVLVQRGGLVTWACGGGRAVFALVRTFWPLREDQAAWRLLPSMLLEVAAGATAVELTGLGRSPFLLSLAVATLVAGYACGLRIVPGLVAMATLAVTIPGFVVAQHPTDAADGVQFATLLLLVGLVGGYGRTLLENAGRVGQGLADQISHLSEVNELLFDLHAATERVPMPLEIAGALAWVLDRLEELFGSDASAVVLRDPVTGRWHIAAAKGLREGTPEDAFTLPAALATAARSEGPVSLGERGHGLDYTSRWGMYAPLRARGELIGLLAVESGTRRVATPSDTRRMQGLASAAALAIDNARWLERIHTFGVEAERSRLARELHDHIGQSMMYLGLELDRMIELNHGRAVRHDLSVLRNDVRTLVAELRDTLVDLRTDVTDDHDVTAILEAFAARVNRRDRVHVSVSSQVEQRLPLAVEREIWRVAQEAVVNAERHARASKVSVLWLCDARRAVLEVTDDGIGLPAGTTGGRAGSYGLVGMRERADAVGAQLDIRSSPGNGTTVRMQIRMA